VNTLPPSLVHFERQLEHAIDDRRSRRRRGLALRATAAAAAAAAIALGVLSALPGNDGLPGPEPSAAARAAAVLSPSDGAILHTVVLTTLKHLDGSVDRGRTETWQQTSPPYDKREKSERELASADGAVQYYNPRTNTIHTTAPNVAPERAPRPGTGGGDLREDMLGLLRSSDAREEGRITVEGRPAIRIVSTEWKETLVIDAVTAEPIEYRITSDEGVRVTNRFQTYELLADTDANRRLVSLRAQHPDATVIRDVTVEGIGGTKKHS
jgi:hypothetical protein